MSTSEHAPPQPAALALARRFLLGLGVIVLLVDLLLAGVDTELEVRAAEDPGAVRALLDELVERASASDADSTATLDAKQTWLLLGDSVLVGDTGRASLRDWQQRRLIDYLARERAVAERERVEFAQLAYSGMLPVDMLALVQELDRHDPKGEVSLLVELSPRYFASAYAEQTEHSRPWFAEFDDAGGRWLGRWDSLLTELRRIAPIYRHRARFRGVRERLAALGVDASEADADEPEAGRRVEALARLRVHYRAPRLDQDSVQVAALLELVARCRAAGRRVVLFTTPVEDGFLAELQTEVEQGDYLARLDRLLAPDGELVRLLPFDHPLFASELFWDHVHLRPEGHRLLAVNLLHQLGVGLERTPASEQLIAHEGFDASLVARVELGSEDGASWQARFARPSALALSEDGRRLIVVDTQNHVLRELHGDMRVVSTLAGVPGEPGVVDTGASEARLSSPRSASFLGADLFVADDGGKLLRRVRGRSVSTLERADPRWVILSLRSRAGVLYALEQRRDRTRIAAIDPATGDERELVRGAAEPGARLRSFAIDPERGLYFATDSGQLWRFDLGHERVVDLARERLVPETGLELRFDNVGRAVLPQAKKHGFPSAFNELHLAEVTDMVWVDRYGVLLVQDLAPHAEPGKYGNPVTERVMLRAFDFEERLIYPWIKPLAAGLGNFHYNRGTKGFSSYFHEGALALDQANATLYYVERERSRLLRLDDGLLGVAQTHEVEFRIREMRSPLQMSAGSRSFGRFVPQRFFAERRLPIPRRGPYTCLLVGSSVLTASDMVGQYSLGRRIGEHLAFELGVRDRVELLLFQRMAHGGPLGKQRALVKEFLDQGGRVDVLVFESNASLFLPADADEAQMLAGIDDMQALARRSGAALILLDTSPFIIRNRDGPRAIPEHIERFLELARVRGVEVVEVGDAMLDEQLSTTPFGTPPMDETHMNPWAIDATARRMAEAMAPFVREQLRGRVPAYAREAEPESPKRVTLDRVFAEIEHPWDEALPRVRLRGLQTTLEDGVLYLFIDLGQLELELGDLDGLILASVYELLVRQHYGAERVELEVGRFDNYDEYGEGVAAGATVVRRETLGREQLRELAKRYAAR